MKNIQVRVEEDLKSQVDAIYEQIGTTTNDAIKMFLKASVREKGFPFALQLPKPQTLEEYVQSKMLHISDKEFRDALNYRIISGKYWKHDEFEAVFHDTLTISGYAGDSEKEVDLADVELFIVDPMKDDFYEAADADSDDLKLVAGAMMPLLEESEPLDGKIAILDEFYLYAPTATAVDRVNLLDDVFRYLNDRDVAYVGFCNAGLWRAESVDQQVALDQALHQAGYRQIKNFDDWAGTVYAFEVPSVETLRPLN